MRELRESDLDALCSIFCDERTLERWPFTLARGEVRAMLARAQESYAQHGFGLWACELRATGEFVGSGGLKAAGEPGEIEAMWHLRRDQWGKGYATEAARGAIEWAFQRGYRRVLAPILPGNAASQRVAERLHMRRQGQVDRHGLAHDLWLLER